MYEHIQSLRRKHVLVNDVRMLNCLIPIGKLPVELLLEDVRHQTQQQLVTK